METKLIREYASKMARIFSQRVSHAKRQRQAQEYLKQLEAKRDFWEKVVQLPSDSQHWQAITSYMTLMCDPTVSKAQLRTLYKSVEEAVNSQKNVSR